MLDLTPDRVAADGALAAMHGDWFRDAGAALPDPRRPPLEHGTTAARLDDPGIADALADWWERRLRDWAAAGVAGFRCLDPERVPAAIWRRLIGAAPECGFVAWTPGLAPEALRALAGAGFAASCDSLAWWDFRQGWLAEEALRLAAVAPPLAVVEAPFGPRIAAGQDDPRLAARDAVRRLRYAAGRGAGLLVPMGFEYGARVPLDPARSRPGDWAWLEENRAYDIGEEIRLANAALVARKGAAGEERPLSGPGAPVSAVLRADGGDLRRARAATLVLANADLTRPATVSAAALLPGTGGHFTAFRPLLPASGEAFGAGDSLDLAPGEVRVLRAEPAPAVRPAAVASAAEAATWPRVAIEAVTPAIENGRFPVKRRLGQTVTVEADLICDGHDVLGAALLWRAADEAEWREARMTLVANDRWTASFPLERMGRYVFAVEAWRDAFASYHHEIEVKHAAGLNLTLEIEEGRRLVEAAGKRAGGEAAALSARLDRAEEAEKLSLLLAPETMAIMAAADDRPFRDRSPEMPVEAERTAAEFASWYELFPRSMSGDPNRHGTFRDVIAHLPRIQAMGFDVLYFPPIHPIGKKNRKGRNNSLTPSETDPGSPYAIGSADGGHDALHPELGTLEDFLALRDAAAAHGMELAIDFAIQCSPEHPWLREHPDWFDWRPDGTIKYAENPPKKYQDIVNVDFYAKGAVPSLWEALRDVVLFWAGQGVRCFRVDNPHTKPLPFWEWMIGEVRAAYPDSIFLAEAFTKPKMMYRLGKVGYGQSYTYFTWRNTKAEMREYLEELTASRDLPQGAPRDFYRPHFFVNTPDINPVFLQTSGRAGHLIRAALATTLSGLWGMYNGFELCEARALPGREEYLDSEKYEIRAWDWDRPGNIVAEITRLNAIRRLNPALQSHLGIAFHNAFNDQVLWYRKQSGDRTNVVLCAVSMDPHNVQEADVELPLWEWGLPDHATLEAEDLMRGTRFAWTGKVQRLRLDPNDLPFGIWRVRPAGGI
nr:alpha-1,4-glucan--maltose-1-phosphate maltosyltransferase [Roseomonas acroporae]